MPRQGCLVTRLRRVSPGPPVRPWSATVAFLACFIPVDYHYRIFPLSPKLRYTLILSFNFWTIIQCIFP